MFSAWISEYVIRRGRFVVKLCDTRITYVNKWSFGIKFYVLVVLRFITDSDGSLDLFVCLSQHCATFIATNLCMYSYIHANHKHLGVTIFNHCFDFCYVSVVA